MTAQVQLQSRNDSRRAMQRSRCAFSASITFMGTYLCAGIIKDISLSGARLLIPGSAWLPSEFEVTSEVFDKPVKVRTVWANREHVGVKFTDN